MTFKIFQSISQKAAQRAGLTWCGCVRSQVPCACFEHDRKHELQIFGWSNSVSQRLKLAWLNLLQVITGTVTLLWGCQWVGLFGFIVPFLLHLALTSTRTRGWSEDILVTRSKVTVTSQDTFLANNWNVNYDNFIQMCDRITLCFDNVTWWRFGQTCRMQLYWLVEA